MSDLEPLSLEGMKTHSLQERTSKVKVEDFAKPWEPGSGLGLWLNNLPRILAANDFLRAVHNIVRAVETKRLVLLAMGAHAIKVGLNPIIIDLLDRGIINGLALNGAGIIHDTELAMVGHTSEDVPARLGEGKFGMTDEPARFLNQAIIDGAKRGVGLGEAVGARLCEEKFPHNHCSILARAFELHIPVTVHVAIGTDTIHAHPSADGASLGKTSHHDFRLFASMISRLEEGVFINLGSAVIIPEVFLKALTLVRNLGHEVKRFTTLNMDFLRHYRPMTNVVHRPTVEGGEGYFIVGHHEIMFPLLAAAVIEGIAGS
ncbi:MAG: hypothetical protein MUO52_11255 [Desulfobacterales bacterium]|nr:hypothetical protein [Desulfobacterales bacterium]